VGRVLVGGHPAPRSVADPVGDFTTSSPVASGGRDPESGFLAIPPADRGTASAVRRESEAGHVRAKVRTLGATTRLAPADSVPSLPSQRQEGNEGRSFLGRQSNRSRRKMAARFASGLLVRGSSAEDPADSGENRKR
jgi:hypothetical protein